ncbi:glycosyltransferase [Streptomyces sp. DT193]|uniref:glycosyltransferase n=1 Tax=Streptomyces sp. DT193 TaxID=3393418 RepID=UPI003CFADE76
MPRILVVSPPFLSHARPLAELGRALRENGAEVWFACTPPFEQLARNAAAHFVPLAVTRNANTGVAEATRQDAEEAARLVEFLEATRQGPLRTLVTQARHRRSDMLADPDGVLDELAALDARLRPDWYLVDQLSYPVTLALHCLGVPYATFCPGHPSYVLSGPDAYFGVPYDWPEALYPAPAELSELLSAARENDALFTALFDEFVHRRAPARPTPARAFGLTSPYTVLYSYPAFPWLPRLAPGPVSLFTGHTVTPSSRLDEAWRKRLEGLRGEGRRIVLVALGTFLSTRDDVLRTVVLDHMHDAAVVVAAGGRSHRLADLAVVMPSVPQQALLEHVDLMVHHGGNNSFTECVRAGVPALVLPFSAISSPSRATRSARARVLSPTRTPQSRPRSVTPSRPCRSRPAHGSPSWPTGSVSTGPDGEPRACSRSCGSGHQHGRPNGLRHRRIRYRATTPVFRTAPAHQARTTR